jgi:hypothetical protein
MLAQPEARSAPVTTSGTKQRPIRADDPVFARLDDVNFELMFISDRCGMDDRIASTHEPTPAPTCRTRLAEQR